MSGVDPDLSSGRHAAPARRWPIGVAAAVILVAVLTGLGWVAVLVIEQIAQALV